MSAAAGALLANHSDLLLTDEMQDRIRKAHKRARKLPGEQPATDVEAPAEPCDAQPAASPPQGAVGRLATTGPASPRTVDSTPVVREYTANEFRAALKQLSGNQLLLDSIVRLAPDTAAVLLEHDALHLSLRGLRHLTPEVAAILAHRGGSLDLSGLREISDEAAAAIAGHSGWLALDGLENLSTAATDSLAKHEHSLSLCGLKAIPDDVAERLADYTGILTLPAAAAISEAGRATLASGLATMRFV